MRMFKQNNINSDFIAESYQQQDVYPGQLRRCHRNSVPSNMVALFNILENPDILVTCLV